MTQSLGGVAEETEKVIELDKETILVIKVEQKYFIAICLARDKQASVSSHFYLKQLWLSYRFFNLKYGLFDNCNDTKLSGLLNEHFVIFWNNIFLKPDIMIRKGLELLWDDKFKVAEFPQMKDPSWESKIIQDILLAKDSYLGIKDIALYHLPKSNVPKKNRLNNKTFGFMRNFTSNLETLPDLSNWIYHLHSVYDELSSHIIAGNVHYKELPTEDQQPATNDNTATTLRPEDNVTSNANFKDKFLHNLTLPISFAYDAVQEVGATTGISSSMSILRDYIPRWPMTTTQEPQESPRMGMNAHNNETESELDRSRYAYLISPMCAELLPDGYKLQKLKLKFTDTDKELNTYDCLFWYYNDVLAIIICHEGFSKIWDQEYLKDLSYKLSEGVRQFYEVAFPTVTHHHDSVESFAYMLVTPTQIKSSIPTCYGSHDTLDVSPLTLVINGLDSMFTGGLGNHNTDDADDGEDNDNDNERNWGVDIMGGLFGYGDSQKVTVKKKKLEKRVRYTNFIDSMDDDKLWELHVMIFKFLESLKNSRRQDGFIEERLLRLNNGVLCYIREDRGNDELVIIVKNWFEMDTMANEGSNGLFSSLGKDVTQWWDSIREGE